MPSEKRSFADIEIRSIGRKLEGYAAVFDSQAKIGAGLLETIKRGAFSKTLETRGDILALVDHDPSRVLARTRSGTLSLEEDSKGLRFSIDLPETQAGKDILALAKRGDLGGMSFGFIATDENIEGNMRELREVDLIEISVVAAFPAYEGTEVYARSANHACASSYLERKIKILELEK